MTSWNVSEAAGDAHRKALVWDQHVCLPMSPNAEISGLSRFVEAGANVVSVCVGIDWMTSDDSLAMIAGLRRQLAADSRLALVGSTDEIIEANALGLTGVIFDMEGTEPLDGDLNMIEQYYERGVRTMAFAYNRRNRAGGGCHDPDDSGLTAFGRAVLGEMNAVGMVPDASHCSVRTSMEMCESSQSPIVISHAVPRALCDHQRNVTDDQIRACAATDGVIGIPGVGVLLGDNEARTERVVAAIEYVADLVGIEHVGLGLDYIFDRDELKTLLRNSTLFPQDAGYAADTNFALMEPERLPALTEALMHSGMSLKDIGDVMGGNFLRVAGATWR